MKRTLITAALTLPALWNGTDPIRATTPDDVDALLTVAPEAQADLRAAAHGQQSGDRATLYTDETGAHVIAVRPVPAAQVKAQRLLAEAYRVAPEACDAVARREGAQDWADLTHGLTFTGQDTGGGCTALVADLRSGHALSLTNGDSRFPDTLQDFYVGVAPTAIEEETFSLFVRGGVVTELFPAA
ncbi:hypothetical protein [Deinococcus xianganensis]|uniref:Uncharacterized protein n=1 Tax=Deinococcus xianganensis TaxID=1507289 RepID=A0A6I4YP58_9DEIO|nr:hypothetical protein [Deinococcus xianganensis]MXV21891.1 hypothetical protein [Deinococcus xianganensis]